MQIELEEPKSTVTALHASQKEIAEDAHNDKDIAKDMIFRSQTSLKKAISLHVLESNNEGGS